MNPSVPARDEHCLSFRVGPHRYGLPLGEVIQILHLLLLAELPGTLPGMLGLMTLRDRLVPVIDLRLRFGSSAPEYKLNTPIIAVQTSRGTAGLVVDEVESIERVPAVDISAYHGTEFAYVRGVARLPHGLLLLVDTDRLTVEVPNSVGDTQA